MRTISNYIARNKWIIGLSAAFIILNAFLIACEWYYLMLLPFGVLIVFWAVTALDRLLFLTVFLVPVSIPLENYAEHLGFNIQLPTEICLLLILIVLLFKIITSNPFDKALLYHPVSIAIYFNLGWLFVTSITSSIPVVSMKFLISRLWFVTAFYFLAGQLFQSNRNIRRYVWLYVTAFIVVIVVALIHMSNHGIFNQQAAHLSARPFMPDHTSYGAILAMLLPFLIGFSVYPKYKINTKIIGWFLTILFMIALVLSYTRAAWISMGVALVCYTFIRLRVKFYLIVLVALVFGSLIIVNRESIVMSMEQNKQDSSKDLEKHLQSIYNIKSDVSNLERLNRWKSAFRMFKERPVLGWGPGTYMFQYAPFQMSRDKTIISTNMGDWGNAHSEYIGPLAESGIPGTLTFVILLIFVFYTALTLYSKLPRGSTSRLILLCALLGLITYCTHGFLNNFLDTDKASALFWGYIAVIVSLDIKQKRRDEVLEK